MKKILTNLLTGALITAAATTFTPKVYANSQPENVQSFKNLCPITGNRTILWNYRGPPRNQLKLRTDYSDSTGNSDEIVDYQGIWEVAFMKYTPTGIKVGAYANDNNSFSNSLPERAGWLSGYMYNDVFSDGEQPDDVVVVHDVFGDGVANDVGGALNIPGDDGTAYYYRDLIINGKRGDTKELPVYSTSSSEIILPEIVTSPYSEIPSENRGAKATYLNGKREGSSGLLDLVEMGESWLSNECGPQNYHCNGADWNTDGQVDLQDFSMMASVWSPSDYLNE